MNGKSFIAGFVIASVLSVGGGAFLIKRIDDEPIILPDYRFFDLKDAQPGHGFVWFSGAITGEGLGYENNHFSAVCSESRLVCDISDYEQIGPKQMGEITNESYPIITWTPDLVVSRSEPGKGACSRVILNIERKRERVQYIREPINQTAPECADADLKLYRWRLGSPPSWKRIHRQ